MILSKERDPRLVTIRRGGTLTDEGLAGVLDPLAQPDGRTNAALLRDGRVLLLDGGRRDMLAVPYAELLDSAAGVVLPTGQPVIQRSNSTVTLLADGRVLVVGGIAGPPDDGGAALASAELWDPASGSFTLTGLADGRARQQCFRLDLDQFGGHHQKGRDFVSVGLFQVV